MKTPIALALSLLLLAGAASRAHAAAAADQDALPAAWSALGLKLGMPYAKARALLLGAGWKAEAAAQDGAPAFADTPEVECGQGWQAICSAGYGKGGEQYALVLGTSDDGKLLVQGTY